MMTMTKNMIFKKIIMFIIFYNIFFYTIFAQTFSQTKTVWQKYKVNNTTNVEITNKYGNIQIFENETDSIIFEITILAKTNNIDKLNPLINSVDFDFNNTNFYITASTIFSSDQTLLSDFKKLSDMFFTSDNILEVNYKVFMPNYLNIKIDNKFGNVHVDNFKNDFNLILSNGNFIAKNLYGNSIMDFNFCEKIEIFSLTNSNISLYYSNLDAEQIKKLTLISKSGNIDIDKIDVLNFDSKRDKFKIDEINYLYGQTYFSDLEVKEISKEADLNLKYGDVFFDKILKTVEKIDIKTLSTNLSLQIDEQVSFELELQEIKANLILANKLSQIQRIKQADGSTKISTKIGATANSKIKLNINDGSLTLDFK